MAKLLVRTVDGENALRYMSGDVVTVAPDGHVFGRMESLVVWTAEGRDPAAWPGGFAILEIEGLSVDDARQYLESSNVMGAARPEMLLRRIWKVDFDSLERRAPDTGRDALRTHRQIKRRWSDADVSAAFGRKP